VVGILDTGVDITHEELQGIVDEELSKDFTSNNTDLSLVDDEGHGTAIASIIAAHTNNSRGIVGVCNNVKIVSLKVLDSGLKGYLSNVIEAVEYANENNIDIINLSLTFRQGFTSNYNVDPNYIDASITLLENAISNYSGLAVCAAGNEETNIDGSQYVCVPAKFNLSNLITVGASKRDDTVAGFSNYGLNSVDLFAPGDDILFAARLEECEEI
jgi:subtilisin family serine protease